MLKRLKIAYITGEDPHNRHSWSGTHYYVWKTLERNIGDVELLGPVKPRLALLLCKAVHGFSLLVLGKRFNYRHSIFLAKAYARIFEKRLAGRSYDLIVAPAGVTYIAYLKTMVPIFYFSDATTANSVNYHLALSNMLGFSRKQSLLIEQRALSKAHIISYPSQWAIDSALKDFHADPSRVYKIPFGTNLETVPGRAVALRPKQKEKLKLFFLAVYWENKGGPIAYAALLELLKKGLNVELTVVGCVPPAEYSHKNMKVIPFLNKNKPEDFKQLQALFKEAHFFFLPTRFEAFCMGFCEAEAYGIPVISTDTGGLSDNTEVGKSGYLLPLQADGKAFADLIAEIWSDQPRYEQMRINSRDLYERARNWDHWADCLKAILEKDPAFGE